MEKRRPRESADAFLFTPRAQTRHARRSNPREAPDRDRLSGGYFFAGAFLAGRAADLPAVFVVGALDAGAALALFFVGATFVAGLAVCGIGGA